MENRRIGPDGGFIREFKDWQKRVQSIESKPAGKITIRETLTTVDPETGVKTIIGELPDGSFGIQPFVYDITPPPVASTPAASAEPGLFAISWDGTFVNGAEQPRDFVAVNVIGHKIVNGTTSSSVPVGRMTTAAKIYVATDVVTVGETWEFSLEAEDYNGNRAEWSARSVLLTMQSLATDVAVDTALAELNTATQEANAAVVIAQQAAQDAQADADAAKAIADKAILSSSKTYLRSGKDATGIVTNSALTPSTIASVVSDGAPGGFALQKTGSANNNVYDLSGMQDFNPDVLYRVTFKVRVVTDHIPAGKVLYAGVVALQADGLTGVTTTGTSSWSSAHYFAANASAITSADGWKTYTGYFKGVAATGNGGLHTDPLNPGTVHTATRKIMPMAILDYLSGTGTWEVGSIELDVVTAEAQKALIDAKAAQLKADQAFNNNVATAKVAGDAQLAADGKATSWYTATAPAGTAHKVGDMWFDEDNGYKLSTWNGSVWQTTQDAALAQFTAESKGRTYTQNTVPPVEARLPQNLWNDTSVGAAGSGLYVTKYWNGSIWALLADKDAKTAQDTADSKGITIYSDNPPAISERLPQNLWIDTTGGININKRWDGSAWVVVADSRIASTATAVTTAQQTADAKGRTYTQGFEPPVDARLPQNIWIDTSAGVNLSVTKYWNGSIWAAVKDAEINAAELRAAQDAKAKADAAALAAINAQAYSRNASFDDWTGTLPAFHSLYGVGGPTKETTIVQRGAYAARFNCTDTTTDRGLNWDTGLLSHAPNLEYFTVEVSFYLASGGSLTGAGVLLDWLGMTNNRATLSLAAEVPTPVTGKWYHISKTLRRPTNATGTWYGMDGFLMANYTASYFGGAKAVKDIIFDWLNIRPSTAEEILAYTAPTTQYVDQAEADAIATASQTAQTKADAARDAAIADTTTKLLGKNKTVWSLNPATGTTGYTAGDTWFQRDGTGAVIAQWEFTTSWQSRTVSEAVIGGLSAGKIISGFIESDRIESGSIAVSKLAVTDLVNFAPSLAESPEDWTLTGGMTIITTSIDPIGVRLDTAITTGTAWAYTPFMAVKPGESLYATATNYRSAGATGNMWLRYYFYNKDKVVLTAPDDYTGAPQSSASASGTKFEVKATVPALAAYARIVMPIAGTAGNNSFHSISGRRMNGGELIVDGAIDGKTITGALIQSTNSPLSGASARGIKFTASELMGFDGAGNKNFSLTSGGSLSLKGAITSGSTITGATVTGATIETTAALTTGIKMTPTGIKAYGSSNNLTFSVDATTGEVEAPGLKANSVTGDKIVAGSLTARELRIGDFTNLITNGYGDLGASVGWGSNYIYDTADKPSEVTGVFKSTAGQGTTSATAVLFDVDPNTEYTTEVWLKASLPDSRIYIELRDQAGLLGTANVLMSNGVSQGGYVLANHIVPTVWTKYYIKTTTTATATRLRVGNLYFNHTNGTERNAVVSVAMAFRRRLGGSLIVDGAIDGKTITGATIQTIDTASRGIKLTDTELAGYDGTTGNKSFSLTSAGALTIKGAIQSGSTIEGARITGTSGLETSTVALTGVKITNSGIKAYDAGNNLSFSVDAATGEVEAPGIKANSLHGDKITSGTILADKVVISRGANLFTDTEMADLPGWNSASFTTGTGKLGFGSYLITTQAGQIGVYYALAAPAKRVRVVAGSTYRIGAWVRTDAAAPIDSLTVYARVYNNSTEAWTFATDVGPSARNKVATVPNEWTFISGMVKIPEGYDSIVLGLYKQSTYTTGAARWSDPIIQQASAGELIVDGAITTKHMTSGTIDAGILSAGSIKSPMIEAKSIGVDRLTITSTDNLIVGGDMALSAASWQKTANITANATAGRGSMPTLRFTGTVSAMTSLNVSNRVTVEPDNKLRCSIFVKSNAALAIGKVKLMIRCYTTATAYTDITGVSNATALVANTWTQVQGVSDNLPANTIAVEFYLNITNPATGTITDIDYVSATRASDGTLIVDGAITAKSLAATIVLASKIVAGNELGTHAQMDPTGFRVFAADTGGGAPNEVVRMGVAASDDYFAITKTNGDLVATISSDGKIVGSQVHAVDELWYKGTEISTKLDQMPQGIIAAAYRDTASAVNASSSANIPYLRLEVPVKGGRIYKIGTSPLKISRTGGSVLIGIKYNNTGGLATLSSGSLTETTVWDEANAPVLQELFSVANDTTISLLMWMGVVGGEAGFRPSAYAPARMFVEDLGNAPYLINNGVALDGTASTTAGKVTYTTSFPSWNSMNYQGSNAQYNFDTGRMYQGQSPAGYGNLKSIALFPDMTTTLAGATINYMRVYFNFNHWYYNSGGTARIGVHPHTAIPGTFTYTGNGQTGGRVVDSGGWPKPGARWVDIPSAEWPKFKSGAMRGISLEGDSSYGTYGYAERPTIEINYTK